MNKDTIYFDMTEKTQKPKSDDPKNSKAIDPETEKEIAEQVGFTLEQDSQMFEG